MLEVKKDLLKGLEVELELEDAEKAVLSAFVKQHGFDLIQKIMEDQVRKFNFKLINTDPADSALVCANHYLAKAVAQFYVGLMERINRECAINAYNNRDRNVVEDAITATVSEFK
jgi:glycogen synthase